MISADADPPVDRPNLSKDFLAGEAQDDWIPLWPNDFYVEQRIELMLGRRVSSIDTAKRIVRLDDGSERQYGALLLATGADPVRLQIPGATDDRVRYLRSFADSRAIVERAGKARRVVVAGASFIWSGSRRVAADPRHRRRCRRSGEHAARAGDGRRGGPGWCDRCTRRRASRFTWVRRWHGSTDGQ
jgi:hypothetical protein